MEDRVASIIGECFLGFQGKGGMRSRGGGHTQRSTRCNDKKAKLITCQVILIPTEEAAQCNEHSHSHRSTSSNISNYRRSNISNKHVMWQTASNTKKKTTKKTNQQKVVQVNSMRANGLARDAVASSSQPSQWLL